MLRIVLYLCEQIKVKSERCPNPAHIVTTRRNLLTVRRGNVYNNRVVIDEKHGVRSGNNARKVITIMSGQIFFFKTDTGKKSGFPRTN